MQRNRTTAVFALALFFTLVVAGVFAEKAPLSYTVTAPWKASVFGDIGGLDKITAENFEVTEKGDGTVVLRSANDRGKIASTSEGIAFYYREVPAGADFELSATASVSSFAKNNQVSFGIMVRDKVYDNEFLKTELGSYLAVGPVQTASTPGQFTFRRGAEGLSRKGDLLKSAPPGPGTTYRLSLRKTGEVYVLSLGDEELLVVSDFTALAGDIRYVGLYTSRNTTVTFSDISFTQK
jgi:hypothetical protein